MKKTAEEAALEEWPIEPMYDFGKNIEVDINEDNRKIFIQGYNYHESLVAAEKEEAVNDYKIVLLEILYKEHDKLLIIRSLDAKWRSVGISMAISIVESLKEI